MNPSMNQAPKFCGRRFADINAMHKEFWRKQAEKTERQFEDQYLVSEAFKDLEEEQKRVPIKFQLPLEAHLNRAEKHRGRALFSDDEQLLQRVRQENGRRGGKCPKADRLQILIEEIVAKRPAIDCPELLKLLSHKQGAGVIVEVQEEEIFFANANGGEKSARIAGLKDRLYRARKKVDSQKAVCASRP